MNFGLSAPMLTSINYEKLREWIMIEYLLHVKRHGARKQTTPPIVVANSSQPAPYLILSWKYIHIFIFYALSPNVAIDSIVMTLVLPVTFQFTASIFNVSCQLHLSRFNVNGWENTFQHNCILFNPLYTIERPHRDWQLIMKNKYNTFVNCSAHILATGIKETWFASRLVSIYLL